jgi:uncharacterized protein YwqG
MAKVLPDMFKGTEKYTYRLHPRAGENGLFDSKLGGKMAWPVDEPWPVSTIFDSIPRVLIIRAKNSPHIKFPLGKELLKFSLPIATSLNPLVPILQLRSEDVPDIEFPKGKNLLQLLWDMDDYPDCTCYIYWRHTDDLLNHKIMDIAYDGGYPNRKPIPCTFTPEKVKEYPDAHNFEDEEYDEINSTGLLTRLVESNKDYKKYFNDNSHVEGLEPLDVYQIGLSSADGTKVGGYCQWVQYDSTPNCDCGKEMEHLLTFASDEFDGASYLRWLPIEDTFAYQTKDHMARRKISTPADWCIGDCGKVYVFVCRACEYWPIKSVFQGC